MPIPKSDVKLLKSQRLTDEDDGGGRATGNEAIDGEVNGMFPDISRLDRTLGRINLRKGFAGVKTANNDAYLGAHAIITQAPADPRVSMLLFAGSQTDERAAARDAIENYVVPGTTAQWELLGNQMVGQRALTGVQREEHRLPEVGEVYQLSHESRSQYVRITSVDGVMENFFYEYQAGQVMILPRRRLQLGISAVLLDTYPGGQVIPAGTSGPKAAVRSTQVADAARYYGVKPLADAIAMGDLSCKVQSVYSHLVPSNTKETPLIDQLAGYNRRQLLASGAARSRALTFSAVSAGQSRAFLTTGALPGSIGLSIDGGVYADNGKGGFVFVSGSNSFSRIDVDYATGQLDAYRTTAFAGPASATYTPAAAATGQTITGEIAITLATRGYVYTLNLAEAKPRPGTLVVSYMALGKWYDLRDQGNGELAGEGTGTIQFASGSVSITLAALPDVGSALIYSYIGATAGEFTQRAGAAVQARVRVRHRLPHDGIEPGSLVATYVSGGVTRTVTDNGNGTLAGAAIGSIVYATGELDLQLDSTPDTASAIQYSYQQGLATSQTLTPAPDGAGTASGTIAGAPLQPGSVHVSWSVIRKQQVPAVASKTTFDETVIVERSARDDGAGGWVDAATGAALSGTLDYATGAYTLRVRGDYDYVEYTYRDNRKLESAS